MREVTTHQLNPINRRLRIRPRYEPGAGGAHTSYSVDVITPHDLGSSIDWMADLRFHAGPGPAPDGLTNEAVIAILIDRLEGFQRGPHPCSENEAAIGSLKTALAVLQRRYERIEAEKAAT